MMPKLRVNSLTKRYGQIDALVDVSFSLDNGIYGLLGPNGAGKTTLIRIVTALLQSDEGEVLWDGQRINSLGAKYRDILGYMPQQQQIYPHLSVEQFLNYVAALKNIAMKDRRTRVDCLLHCLNLIAQARQRISTLSGGMRQRVLIAQALLNEPQFLVLDEPTAGLDPSERANLRSLIADVARDRIVLLATHVVSDIEYIAKHVLLMKDGRLIKIEEQSRLLQNTSVYLSTLTSEELHKLDPDHKVVNIMPAQRGNIYRIVSRKALSLERTETNLDDVYLDLLG